MKALTVGAPYSIPILSIGDVDAYPNDVAARSAKPLDCLEDDFETPFRLLVGIALDRLPILVDGGGS